MPGKGIITVDIGTSSLRAVLFNERGRVLAVSRRDNPPDFLEGGRVQQNSDTWRTLVPEVLKDCAEHAGRLGTKVTALALTAQRSSVIPVDAQGKALYPAIMWQDTRTEGLCTRMAASHGLVYGRTGLRISPVFSAVKMTWLKENENPVYKATHRMMGIQDFVIHELTGTFVTDRSLASRTNLFNLHTLDWDDELISLFGIERKLLCDLVDPGDIAGYLNAAQASATGLPAGIPVVSAGGDQQCAALGLGLLGPGRMIANTGTGSYLITGSLQPKADPGMGIACNVAAVPGTFILEAGVLTSGSVYQWFRKEFYREPMAEGASKYTQIDSEAAASPPGANGVILLPHFRGRGSPTWNPAAKGAFLNLNPGITRGDMARSILEGIALEMAENIEALEALAGKAKSIEVSGGMTASALYNHIQADCYGRRIERPDDAEATALGAWISCAVKVGLYASFAKAFEAATESAPREEFQPNPDNYAVYRALAEKRKQQYVGLTGSNAS